MRLGRFVSFRTAMKLPRPHVGKIARLPAGIREETNRRLYDNQPYAKIIVWLHEQPEVLQILTEWFHGSPITLNNLSAWKRGIKGRRGGYQEWLDKKRFEEEELAKIHVLGSLIAGAVARVPRGQNR